MADKTREQLNDEARAAGVTDPEQLPNREAVAAAIAEKQQPGTGASSAAGAGDQAAVPPAADTSAATAAPPAEVQARTDTPRSLPAQDAQPVLEQVQPAGGFVSALPILTPGDAGPLVMELAVLLHQHGFENPVATGHAPAILTDALMDRVREFQSDQGHDPRKVEEGGEQSPFRNRAEGVVDARTWQLLLGAAPSYDRLEGART